MSDEPTFQLVEVEWLDSVGESHWRETPDALHEAEADDLVHFTVGFVLAENERYILVASSKNSSGARVADALTIPRVAVVAVHPLTRRRGS